MIMVLVRFWLIGDTIVNINKPIQTFTVVSIIKMKVGNWVTLENVHTLEKFSGYELRMQGLGLVGYRKDNCLILVNS